MASVENTGVFLGSLDAVSVDKSSTKLVSTNQSPVYAPSPDTAVGHLLFLRRSTLMAQLKKVVEPLKVLGILRRDIPSLFFQATRAQQTAYAFSPREVILSSYLLKAK